MDTTTETAEPKPKRGYQAHGGPVSAILIRVPRDVMERVKEITGAGSGNNAIRALLFAADKAGADGKIKMAEVREAVAAARQMTGA